LVKDLSIYLVPGRETDPKRAFAQAIDAERLGLRRAFFSERWDTKEAGVIAGGVAARTTRIEIATGLVAVGSRHPLLMAALGTTMQATSDGRFVLGLGRSDKHYMESQSMRQVSYDGYVDYVDILRRLWRGETVSYDGPAGTYDSLTMVDIPDCEPPPIWTGIYGGPRASRVAAQVSDGVLLIDFLTPEATHSAVTSIRHERDRLGLDPAIPVGVCVITAPDLDDIRTKNLTSARFVTYVVGLPQSARAYAANNGWDEEIMRRISAHPLFANMDRPNADQSFHRHQLYEVAELVPESWMRECCAIGSVSACAQTLQSFRDAGADEIVLYASTPEENAGLIAAWRQ
jgi:probable F420-dependent oxidoreductase